MRISSVRVDEWVGLGKVEGGEMRGSEVKNMRNRKVGLVRGMRRGGRRRSNGIVMNN